MNTWLRLLRVPNLAAQAGIDRDIKAGIRLNFLHAAYASGLLGQLRQGKQRFELVLRSTLGCAPMGTVEEFISQLHESGFREVTTTRLIPVETFFGVTASM